MSKMLFTSESVTEGHPDKVCDRISDAILDEILKNDPDARVACETFCTTGSITVMGEITTSCYADIPKIARDVVCEIGYSDPSAGFDGNTCAVMTAIGSRPTLQWVLTARLNIKTARRTSITLTVREIRE